MHDGPYLNFRSAGTGLVLDRTGSGLPRVVHWGVDLGELSQETMAELALAQVPQVASNNVDLAVPLALLPEHSAGWQGTPGLTGHRAGADFSTAFTVTASEVGERSLSLTAEDVVAALELRLEIELTPSGLVRQRATLTSQADEATAPFSLGALLLALPVPERATELLDMTGRHLRERTPQRHEFTIGTHLRDNRKGRTGTDAVTVHIAGEADFGFRAGEVWGLHVAWSGNQRSLAERTHTGVSLLAGGELPLAGEITLGSGDSYTTPWIYGSYGREGLDELAARFHGFLRARPHHPTGARPVTLNVWEAVYFDHRLPKLRELADAAAEIGAERFVLDDGWFRGRRDDHAGLGDWYVDEDVWPEGLHPLAEYVRGLGLEFGLWVEPEMVNQNSDLARAHPEWIMATGDRLPPESRNQQVLDLGHPGAYAYILERLDAIVGEYALTYLKWDHNRDLVEAGHSPTGQAGVHRQTLAVYRLLDELRARHPGLEIESCSSGGGRVDLGVLERTDRVWTSDCIDALERQRIQRWTGLLLPPELMGSHVGAPRAHTTGRTHGLEFRAGTAISGHFGIEWDLTSASADDRAALAEWITLYKELRPLLHTGHVVREDHPDPALWVHGVVAQDGARAVFTLAQVATSVQAPPGMVRLPGLDPEARYRVTPLAPAARSVGPAMNALSWWDRGVTLPGRVLGTIGVRAPIQHPERLLLLDVVRVDG
ncbi:alpha-galactosidase [Streptomyces profundus]|uniref:alpha-galactosidase n=1 Tax=Streptomyces profundus TaxID=2867410 RepID=UPI001D16E894|nr:alpha-galactosidase [Streptomyces sp. MA3_2.13]UED84785.1 alpha-galactosidase [Streptomyces sp. MA3_2.13]